MHFFDSLNEHSLKLSFSRSVQLVLEIKEELVLNGFEAGFLQHELPRSISE